jgi:hypothetical protein
MSREIKRVPLDFNWPCEKVWEGFLLPNHLYADHCQNCLNCEGSGYSWKGKELYDQWYGLRPFRPEDTGCTPFSENHPIVRAMALRNVKQAFYGIKKSGVMKEALRLAKLFNASWSHNLDTDDVAALLDADRLWEFTRTARTPEQMEVVRQKVAIGGNSWLPERNDYVPTPSEVNDWSLGFLGHDSLNCHICIKAKCTRLGFSYECETCYGKGSLWDSPENERINRPLGKAGRYGRSFLKVRPFLRFLLGRNDWQTG